MDMTKSYREHNKQVVFDSEKINKRGSFIGYAEFCAEWKKATDKLIQSGYDLSKIEIREKRAKHGAIF